MTTRVTERMLNESFRGGFTYWWYYPFTTAGGAVT